MIAKALRQLNANTPLAQLIRFAITGGGVTVLGAGLYLAMVSLTHVNEQVAVFAAYVLCVMIGYGLHSRFSFRGHGSRDNVAGTTSRFVAVSLLSYGLNAFFTWALVRGLDLPRWTPVLPIVFVTPLVTFTLNRRWVFR